MINGRIYDAATLAQLGNHPAAAPVRTWREGGTTAGRSDSEGIEH
jgi:hypothetical protein